ncbi:30S ribosomal protein S16 [candidate division KSB1 bacterium 4572_119]|nr:MAG: 30S ribosomal protein S16 [candidate division KSB1 bacterium 4572_119]
MAVKLRLTRRGKKKQPFYRIVAIDSRTARDGKYLDKIGHYNPLTNPAEIIIDEEKSFYWLKNGAVLTDTVKNLFSKKGIMLKWSLMKKGADDQKIEEEFKKWELLQIEREKKQEALKAQESREKEKAKDETAEKEEAEAKVEETEVMDTKADAKIEETEPKVEEAEAIVEDTPKKDAEVSGKPEEETAAETQDANVEETAPETKKTDSE